MGKKKVISFDIITTQIVLDLPVETSLGIHLGIIPRSLMGVRTPSMLPNMEERPKLKSMIKNSKAHTWEPGISITASVNMIKARPVPDADWERRKRKRGKTAMRKHEFAVHVLCPLHGKGKSKGDKSR